MYWSVMSCCANPPQGACTDHDQSEGGEGGQRTAGFVSWSGPVRCRVSVWEQECEQSPIDWLQV
jgi:hypothetical protein